MFFRSKQRHIESRIEEYCRMVLECVTQSRKAIEEQCHKPDRAHAKENFAAVHHLESGADDIRREVELLMYTKALFPESRSDILGLLETMDKIPNQAESCVRSLYEQNISIPAEFQSKLLELLSVCQQCAKATADSVCKLFQDYTHAATTVGEIDRFESTADHIESELKENIFSSDMDALNKIVLRDLISHISGICDRSEAVGDRIRIMVAKRGI